MELFRGLRSGVTPLQAQRWICKRWTLKRCHKLRRVSHRQGALYLYKEEAAFPCTYRLYFSPLGLFKVQVSCQVHEEVQRNALLRRYRRWYGAPSRSSPATAARKQVYRWRVRAKSQRVFLQFLDRDILAEHEDVRTSWARGLLSLRPSPSQSDAVVWKAWVQSPRALQKEVLENFLRLFIHWRGYLHKKTSRPLPSSAGWTPPQQQSQCEPLQVNAKLWGGSPWRALRYLPLSPRRLHYRLRFLKFIKTRAPKRFSSRFSWLTKKRKRLISLEAEGCGYHFQVRVEERGRKLLHFRLHVKKLFSS